MLSEREKTPHEIQIEQEQEKIEAIKDSIFKILNESLTLESLLEERLDNDTSTILYSDSGKSRELLKKREKFIEIKNKLLERSKTIEVNWYGSLAHFMSRVEKVCDTFSHTTKSYNDAIETRELQNKTNKVEMDKITSQYDSILADLHEKTENLVSEKLVKESQLKTIIDSNKKREDEIQVKLAAIEEVNNELLEVEILNKRMSELLITNGNLKTSKHKILNRIDEESTEFDLLSDKLSCLTAEKTHLECKLQCLLEVQDIRKKELQAEEERLEQLTNQLSVCQIQLDETKKQIEIKTAENVQLSQSFQEIQTECNNLKKKIEEKEKNQTTIYEIRQKIEEDLLLAQKEEDENLTELTALEKELANIENSSKVLEEENQKLALNFHSLMNRLSEVREEKTNLEAKVRELSQYEEYLKDSRDIEKDLKEKIVQLDVEYQRLSSAQCDETERGYLINTDRDDGNGTPQYSFSTEANEGKKFRQENSPSYYLGGDNSFMFDSSSEESSCAENVFARDWQYGHGSTESDFNCTDYAQIHESLVEEMQETTFARKNKQLGWVRPDKQ